MEIVNFKDHLQTKVQAFCSNEGIDSIQTANIISALISSLANYKEEGQKLTPKVVICENIHELQKVTASSEICPIGSGESVCNTALLTLKRCAPLARNGWSIFIEKKENNLNYGLIRSNIHPVAVSDKSVLLDPDIKQCVILLSQLSENVVLLTGNSGGKIAISLSPSKNISSNDEIAELIKACTQDIDTSYQLKVSAVLNQEFFKILNSSHGALVAVIESGKVPPTELCDGIYFKEPLSLLERIAHASEKIDYESYDNLIALLSLLEGMVSCDGITMLNSSGQILGYNIFFKDENTISSPSHILGGARKRTFEGLSSIVPDKLVAAFIRSQDGEQNIKFEG